MLSTKALIDDPEKGWSDCLNDVCDQLDPVIGSALKDSFLIEFEASKKTIEVGFHGQFNLDFLSDKSRKKLIEKIISDFYQEKITLKFSMSKKPKKLITKNSSRPKMVLEQQTYTDNDQVSTNGKVKKERSRVPRANILNPRYTFETYVQASSNRLASAAARAVAEQPAKAYNPLFLYGGVGLGKTHLMHAIGHYVLDRSPSKNVAYISAERFTNETINSIQNNSMAEFRDRYRTVDILLIDDIQFLANKERTQEEFFHTFNELHAANKQIVISSDRAPRLIPTLEDRLRSRFEWGMLADIQSPDFETRIAILNTKAQQSNSFLSGEVAEYIAEKIPSNIRELEGALTRVLAFSSLQKEPITLELVQQALKGLIPEDRLTNINIETIQRTVCDYFNVSRKDILGKRRDQKIVKPRQIAMYFCKELTEHSYAEIGQEFGGRDHSTVVHSYRKIDRQLEDANFKVSIKNIEQRLRQSK